LSVLRPFYCGHCIVCPSSNYGIWLPLWYLYTSIWKWKITHSSSFYVFSSATKHQYRVLVI